MAFLPCGEHAMCVECICNLKKTSDKASTDLCCPLCRTVVSTDFVQNLPAQMIDADQELAMLTVKLPVDADVRYDITGKLLWKKHFAVPAVIEVLESMLDGDTRGILFQEEVDLTHKEKDEIYQKARRPVEDLQIKISGLVQEQKCYLCYNHIKTNCQRIASAEIRSCSCPA